ncbi:hypothetical protein B0A52_02459 [Exophiala mesophila]|uniref:Major facilitator superfamily (MFS) profile domain-containing protein n=1 Tax=Exophiala mesophila TaxID=212818 RepID=A0A438NCT1_EXOME|nr:hypothetical protein B0A52_02459 [Exophiala mesophila]
MSTLTADNQTTPSGPVIVQPMEFGLTFKSIFISTLTCLSGIFTGYNAAYGKGALGLDPFTVNWTQRQAFIIFVLGIGAILGSIASGDLSDRLGRRPTIILGSQLCNIGAILQAAVPEYTTTVAARCISGIGLGFVSATMMTYICEISPPHFRAVAMTFYNSGTAVGLLVALCVSYKTQSYSANTSFRITTAIQILWATLLGLFWFLPESPRYLVKCGNLTKAKRALAHLRGQPQSLADMDQMPPELGEMIAHDEHHVRLLPQGRYLTDWANCFRGPLWVQRYNSNLRRTILGVSLMMMQQLSGSNALLNFVTVIIKAIDTISDPFIISLIPTLICVVCLPFSFVVLEVVGRRNALLWGSALMLFCHVIIACTGVADGRMGLALITETLVGEIFPPTIRSRAIGLSTASYWLWNSVTWILLPYISSADDARYGSRMYFLWGCLSGCAYVYTYVLVPETQGLTLEQIDMMLENTIPRRSTKWIPTTTFVEQRGIDSRDRLREAEAQVEAGVETGAETGEGGHKLEDLTRNTPAA